MTVSKRLADFQATPAAQLTLREFHAQAESTEEQDPPSFQLSQRRTENEERARKGLPLLPKDPRTDPQLCLPAPGALAQTATALVQHARVHAARRKPPQPRSITSHRRQKQFESAKSEMYDEIREAFEIQKAEAPARPVIQRKTIENGEEDPSDFSDVADADVDAFVLSAEEARKKAEMWERMNEDYITREEKNKLREAREQAQAQGQPPPGKKPKPRKKSSL